MGTWRLLVLGSVTSLALSGFHTIAEAQSVSGNSVNESNATASAAQSTPSAGPQPSAAQVANEAGELSEIVVTATKRSENLQDVPSSIAAIAGESLHTEGVTDFSQYMGLVPNLTQYDSGAPGMGMVILRGLDSGYSQASNTIGYYIDDIPFNASSALGEASTVTPDPDLADVDHIEVLEGPQGTLYGASTLGGLIRIITKKPDLTSDSGEVTVDGSALSTGHTGYGLAGIGNAVIIPNELAVRVDLSDRDVPGYMTNVTLNHTGEDYTRKESGKISVRWVPTGDLDIQLTAYLQRMLTNGYNNEFVDPITLRPLYGNYTYASPFDPKYATTYRLFNADINWKVGTAGTLTNSTSYTYYQLHDFFDYTPWYGYLDTFAPEPLPGPQCVALQRECIAAPAVGGTFLDKFTEEVRFASNRMGGFEWIAGLFYTHEQTNIPYDNFNSAYPYFQAPIQGPDSIILRLWAPSTYEEESAYANLTYYFNDALDLTLGGRESRDHTDLTTYNGGFVNALPAVIYGSAHFSDATWSATLSGKPAPGLNAYGRIATSFRPGGPNENPVPGYTSFQPDTLTNYEVGFKGLWLQRSLQTDIAIYYMDWKNIQMGFLTPQGYEVDTNGGRATAKGLEFQSQYVPVHGLTLGLETAYSEPVLKSILPGVSAATGGVAGDTLPFSPKWSGSLTADYTMPLTGTMTSNFGATYRYTGARWSNYPGAAINGGVLMPTYHTIDLRAGVQWSEKYKLQFHVMNLTNVVAINAVDNQQIESGTFPAWATVIPPRMYDLSFDVIF